MTQWMQELLLVTEAEYHARRVVGTLATVDRDGHPRARSIFVRRIDPSDSSFWITTDARSSKIADLKAHPAAELVFWTPHERVQFRLQGQVDVVREGPIRQEIWEGLKDAGRALFFWPAPGQLRRAEDHFAQSVPVETPPPESFVLLALRPIEVEALELNDFPHRRRRWNKANGWKVELINP